jgi:hypothetical protein
VAVSETMTRRLLLFLAILATQSWVSAATFCVTDTAELEAALLTARSNNADDEIRLQVNTYAIPTDGFWYSPNASDEDNDITLVGGYLPNIISPCLGDPVPDPLLTVLDGNQSGRILGVDLPAAGNVEIRNLTFSGGVVPGGPGTGGGAIIMNRKVGQTFAGRITVAGNFFLSNSADIGGALVIQVQGTASTDIEVLNNFFFLNTSRNNSGAAQIVASAPPPPPGPLITPLPALTFAHNTVLNNQDDPDQGAFAVSGVLLTGDMANVWVASNNFWANDREDLSLSFQSDNVVRLLNNNIEDFSSNRPVDVDAGNISVEPTYVDCGPSCRDRVPTTDSSLIDGGYTPSFFFQPWVLPETDLTGGPRQRGEQVDIGAYEGLPNILFHDRFED